MSAASSMQGLICFLGVSLIAVVGLVMTLVSIKRQPQVARWSASAGLLAMVFVSLLAVLPTPRWCIAFGESINRGADVSAIEHEVDQHSSTELSLSQSPDHPLRSGVPGSSLGIAFDALHRINALGSHSSENELPNAVPWLILFLISLGLLRFTVQAIGVFAWARRVSDVREPSVLSILHSTRRRLGCSRQIRLCCASDATDAAVIGWRKPCLVLPSDYSQWSTRDLQSVIAHEVSHVRENDFAWRVVFRFVGAFYLFNPLVHLFYRCFVLAQERVADVTASGLVGHKSYMQSVSRFALKRDRVFWGNDPSLFSPVFSGEVIRRIKMLKEVQSIRVGRQSMWTKAFTAVVFAGLVLAVIGVRVAAEPPSERVARLPAGRASVKQASPQELSQRNSAVDPTAGMFRRAVVSPDDLPENESGMFHYNVGALARHPEFKTSISWINTTFAKALHNTFGAQESPVVRLSEIESIIGLCTVKVDYIPERERSGRLILGSSGVAVTFNKQVDLDRWMRDFVPQAQRLDLDGTVCYELPVYPQFGPKPLKLAVQDSARTLCLGGVLDYRARLNDDQESTEFRRLVNHEATPNDSRWSGTFRQVSGGLVTAATSTRRFDLRSLGEDGKEEERLIKQVLESCHSVGIGVDWSDDGLMGVRIRLAIDNHESAQRSLERCKRIREISLATEDDIESKTVREFLESVFVDVEQHNDGSADVILHGAFSMTMAELILDEFSSSNGSADEVAAE